MGSAVEDISIVYWQIQSLYEAALRGKKTNILSLPPEILCMILKEIGDDSKSIKNAMLACSKLRDVAIEEPSLWCTIRNTDTAAHWKRCLDRSLGRDLTIRIMRPKTEVYKSTWLQKDFCRLISMECGRWKELHIELGGSGDIGFSSHGYLKNLHLPKLSILSVEYLEFTGHPLLLNVIIRTWTIPNLKRFVGLPLEGLVKFADLVTSCEFIVEDRFLGPMSHVLKDLLLKSSGCRNLKLTLFRDDRTDVNEVVVGYVNVLFPTMDLTSILPELHSLWLTFSPSHIEKRLTIEHLFLHTIPAQRIVELTLEICEKYNFVYHQPPLHSISSAAAWEFSQVRSLHLIMGHIRDYRYPFISNRMYNLEHLTICSFDAEEPTERFSDILNSGNLPAGLKTVTFRDCVNLNHNYLLDLGQTLASDETFEKLEIIDCALSTDTKLELMMSLQERFSRACSVPKRSPSTNLYQKRLIYARSSKTPH